MIKQPLSIPHAPGVYIFYRRNIPIYIGKAAHLKKRLISYWRKNAGEKVARLLAESTRIAWIQTVSDIDALLKEAELIKKYYPRYNVLMRDDKNYFYVGITKEKYPRISITHQPQEKIRNYEQYIGPFTNSAALKTTLRLLRKIFPYCTCKTPHKHSCLNAEIGKCFGFCCNKNMEPILNGIKKEYKESIKNSIMILMGRRKKLCTILNQSMQSASKNQEYEKAALFRNQILGIENVFGHRQALGNTHRAAAIRWSKIERNVQSLMNTKKKISRVEGYDISNIQGTAATGSMVVFMQGKPAKSEYRKFHIKTVRGISDVDMHKEVLRRRLSHPEWQYPDLMVIDGGKPQLNAVKTVLKFQIQNLKFKILLAALAKREEELYIEGRKKPVRLDSLPPPTKFFFQHVRDESHRFAKKYHHKLREIYYRAPQQNA